MGLKTPRAYEGILLDKFRPFVEEALENIKSSKSNKLISPSPATQARKGAHRRLTFETWVEGVDFSDEYWKKLQQIIVDSFAVERSDPLSYLQNAQSQASTSSWAPMPRPSRYLIDDSSDSDDDAFPTFTSGNGNARGDEDDNQMGSTSLRRTASLRRVGRIQRSAGGRLSASTSRNRLPHNLTDLQGIELPPLVFTRDESALRHSLRSPRETSSLEAFVNSLNHRSAAAGDSAHQSTGGLPLPSPFSRTQSSNPVAAAIDPPPTFTVSTRLEPTAMVDADLGVKAELLRATLDTYKLDAPNLSTSGNWQDRAFAHRLEQVMGKMTSLIDEMEDLRELRRIWACSDGEEVGYEGEQGSAANPNSDRMTLPLPPIRPEDDGAYHQSTAIIDRHRTLTSTSPRAIVPPDDPRSWRWARPPPPSTTTAPPIENDSFSTFEEFTTLGRAAARSRMRNSERRRRRWTSQVEEDEQEEQELV